MEINASMVKECAKEKGLKHNITKDKFSMDCISKIKGMGTE